MTPPVSGPRITPGTFRELGPVNWLFTQGAARVMGVDNTRIFATLGRSKGLFQGWLHFGARLMPFGHLSRRDAERVILRVATQRGCDYELDHHRRLGARAGLSRDEIERLTNTSHPAETRWDPRTAALVTAVDELLATKDLSDATWELLAAHLNSPELIEFVMLVGQYDSLATTIGVLRVERDHAR